MTDEAQQLARQAAYAKTVLARARATREAGFVVCLIGVLILIAARFLAGWPAWGVWLGLAVILLGWALFVVSIVRRANWVRAHPFDLNG